jgi:hypothetical protein
MLLNMVSLPPFCDAAFLHEPLILSCQQMGFDLARRVKRNTHHNQEGGASKIKWDTEGTYQYTGKDTNS